MKSEYRVVVGNIGQVYCGPSKRMARREFGYYVKQSKSGSGRAGNEDVVLFCDNDILDEFSATDWRLALADRKIARLQKALERAAHLVRNAESQRNELIAAMEA